MDFSNNAFSTPVSTSKVSDDTMSHMNLVMACRWGWTSTDSASAQSPQAMSNQPSTTNFNNVRSKRFAPCQGRLYHQLLCSHRVRTDLVEDCGANCVEPFGSVAGAAFICNKCLEDEAMKIWEDRKAQHNATYPPMEQMTKDQYDHYYMEHRQLETAFAHDRKAYESELRATTRPSNICSAMEASKEEAKFATELDSLSLSLMASNRNVANHASTQHQARGRVSLPCDASEQLHWDLNTLALGRGSCGIEYSAKSPTKAESALQPMSEEELWRKPRG
ncbi:hypothetical protein DE146DRAFT_607424 [Phaeosphaeria sp. MPI-PUGE-AT-0046c]|nr:hypothetical protein DE146DRAFT_607424 [Phaeosphaeria sp. MPI-PUGE-AT-0046c]